MINNPKSILITGASSGIGEALAMHYAQEGVSIFMNGRDTKRLAASANNCRKKGAEVYERVLDVAKPSIVANWIKECDDIKPLDLIIANAGVSGGTGGTSEPEEQIRLMVDININGVINTVLPSIEIFKKRKSGQIALISSMTAYRGLPSAPTYSATKAFVKSWGAALRGCLKKEGIKVSVVCPGFIKSRITDANNFTMPFLMDAEKAASIIGKGLENNKSCIAFPWQMVFPTWLLSILPQAFSDKIVALMPAKPQNNS
ncbi:MAG: SDR family NAD(P)-dependent oxidoreductase [Alphaproteobacteria bacterium]